MPYEKAQLFTKSGGEKKKRIKRFIFGEKRNKTREYIFVRFLENIRIQMCTKFEILNKNFMAKNGNGGGGRVRTMEGKGCGGS